MKALVQDRYGPPSVLSVADIEQPTISADEVLIRVHAAGVDQGVWHLMAGRPYAVRLGFGFGRPRQRVRGGDVAGEVVAVGDGVTRFKPGDIVFGTGVGTYAELARASADTLAIRPSNLTYVEAAATPVSGVTALQALRDKAQVRPGQRVAILGAGGGVGTFAVQLAVAMGASVTAVCGPTKGELVSGLGADEVVDYTRTDITDGTRRFDAVVDLAGNRPLWSLRRALVPGGVLVLAGGEGSGSLLGGADRQLRAPFVAPIARRRMTPLLARVTAADLDALAPYLADGRVRPVVDRTFTLEEAPEAIEYLRAGRARGKVVITL